MTQEIPLVARRLSVVGLPEDKDERAENSHEREVVKAIIARWGISGRAVRTACEQLFGEADLRLAALYKLHDDLPLYCYPEANFKWPATLMGFWSPKLCQRLIDLWESTEEEKPSIFDGRVTVACVKLTGKPGGLALHNAGVQKAAGARTLLRGEGDLRLTLEPLGQLLAGVNWEPSSAG